MSDDIQKNGDMAATGKKSVLKTAGEFIWNSIGAIFRGEFLIRLRFDRYFMHIIYLFFLAVLSIWIKLEIEQTMATMEDNKEILEDYKIYHATILMPENPQGKEKRKIHAMD